MAGQRSKRRSRKRGRTATAPRAVPSPRRERRTQREVLAREERQRQPRPRADPRGERPPSPFGGIPVSEFAIFAGLVATVVGYFEHGGPALVGGIILCALGVMEFTAREHFAGFRSHTILLAAIPTIGVEYLLVQVMPSSWPRETALLGDVIVFTALFWPLRSRFLRSRQARLARPPRA